MFKKETLIVGLTVLIVLIVGNFLSSRHFLRFDLTEGKQYTLAKSTKSLLKDLDDAVTLKVYFSKDLPPAALPLKNQVDDMLQEYRAYAGSKLNIEYIDPAESPEREREVQMMGIPPLQLNVVKRDKTELAKIYLGMAILFEDKKQVIPVIQDLSSLEYELTSGIIKVSTKELPKIGWIGAGDFNAIQEDIRKRFDIVNIDPAKPSIDSSKVSAIVLASPKKVDKGLADTLDKYVSDGGSLIALVDSAEIGRDLTTTPVETGSDDFLNKYGLTVEKNLIADRSNAHAAFSGGYVTYQVPYPFWVQVRRETMDNENLIVSTLDAIVMPWTSGIAVSDSLPNGMTATVLAKATPYAASIDLSDGFVRLDPESASKALYNANAASKNLAVLVEGKGRILLVGNSRIIQDQFLQQSSSGAAFFENAVDMFVMGDKLIGIRTRAKAERPIAQIGDGTKQVIRWANILGAPMIILMIGLTFWVIRRSKMRIVKEIYS